MNDRPNPNNLQDSVEARLARAAQQLDTAAANYAYRTTTEVDTSPITMGSTARSGRVASPRRRFAPFAAIGGAIAFAGSLVFGASVISNRASKTPPSVPIEVASPSTSVVPTSDFPFIGVLNISLPSSQLKGSEVLVFRNGVAISSVDQRRFSLAAAIDIDSDGDGRKELAVLISNDAFASNTAPTIPGTKGVDASKGVLRKNALSKNSPSKAELSKAELSKSAASTDTMSQKAPSKLSKSNPKALDSVPVSTSAIALVRVTDGVAQTLATTPTFDTHVDGLLMNRKTLWAMSYVPGGASGSSKLAPSPDSEEAILQRALIGTSTGLISWATAEQPIARTSLPLIVEGDQQIRFSPGTTSALVFAGGGTRTGWFTAKAGQTLTIATIGIPSSKTRQIAIRLRTGSNNQTLVSNGVLPSALTTVLPHGGDYEVLVSESSAQRGVDTTFELSIK
jgi:hypothetical protein